MPGLDRATSGSAPFSMRLVTFSLTFGLLAVVQVVVHKPMLMAERFLSGAGWIEAFVLALYASLIVGALHNQKRTALWRRWLWTLFSVVFFAQLALGLSGIDRFLMSGELHLPIPAVLVAGPIYRGDGFFMPILFTATVLLVGPAWCSYLCYIGSWDLNSSLSRKSSVQLPRRNIWVRVGILIGVIAVAILLRLLGVGTIAATLVGAAFGMIGVGVILFVSRHSGTMVHCVTYCPIGLIADILGKLSVFRLRISDSCFKCGACSYKCRYGALRPQDIEARRPGLSCTVCGDCLSSCKAGSIGYTFANLSGATARNVFLVSVVSLHAVFLGVARI